MERHQSSELAHAWRIFVSHACTRTGCIRDKLESESMTGVGVMSDES